MQMRNPRPARSGLDGPTRLLIVAVGIAAAAWFIAPEYINSAHEVGGQLHTLAARGCAWSWGRLSCPMRDSLPGRHVVGCGLEGVRCDGEDQP